MKKTTKMTLLLVALSAVFCNAAWAAKEPIMSLRLNTIAPEVEVHISQFGMGVAYESVNANDGSCTATGNRIFEFARYFSMVRRTAGIWASWRTRSTSPYRPIAL